MRLNAALNPHQASRMATTCMQAKPPASIQSFKLDAIISPGHLGLTRRGGKRAFIPQRQIHTALAAPSTLVASNAEPKTLELPSSFQGYVTYQVVENIDYDEVTKLLEKVEWPARQRAKLEIALQNSYMLATLVSHCPQQSPAMIGMARVVSDGAFNAQLWDVMVDPDFQGMGLGRQLVSEVVKTLLKEDISNIVTFSEKSGTKFYEKIGFEIDPDKIRGMFYRKML